MLIQGCKREQPVDNNPPPAMDTNIPAVDTNTPPPVADTNTPPPMAPIAQSNTAVVTPPPQPVVPPETVAASTYAVVQGDTLAKIAKAHGVSVKALEAANPGVDPKKLKIKQQLNIPAATQSTGISSATPAGTPDMATGGESYTVKSGDTLSKIAKRHGVSLKALRAANPKIAATDHIHVGDKLTIPSKADTNAPAATTTDASAMPVVPPPAATPTPSMPAPAPGH
jgi:LysM repeat protein